MKRLAPGWLRDYRREWLAGDLVAGVVVAVMLVPQSLAYAMLAGLPPQAGLYASILPLLAYALFGSSSTLAVGPVAVASLMTASALQPLAAPGSPEYVQLAMQLAFLSGLMLLAFGALRLGFLAQLLSHPVISGFITGSALLIALGQLKFIFGIRVAGTTPVEQVVGLLRGLPETHGPTLALGAGALVFLVAARRYAASALARAGVPAAAADIAARLAPMLAVIVSIAAVGALGLAARGVSVVGAVPGGLPAPVLPLPDAGALAKLWLPALLIALIGFVESVSVAQALAMKRGERIDANRELHGLGAANVASAISGGFPVTGGFARSVINFAAGARTQLAGVLSAVLMAAAIAFATGLLHDLPHAVLAATIIVAVLSLVDLRTLREAWRYDRADALSLLATAAGVLVLGVEAGIVAGIALSLAALVWRSSRPHIAVIGRVPGTEHFRNVERHSVQTQPGLLALRVDESLFFANAHHVQERVESLVARDPSIRRVLLVCSAVNQVDATGLHMLEQLEASLRHRGIEFLLAEVKGPVMDRLAATALGRTLQGRICLSTHEAFERTARQGP